MPKVDRETLEKLIDYHHFHGDTDVRCIKVFKAARGIEYYLMRFNDANCLKYSSIDTLMPGKDEAYVFEMISAMREYEKGMIEQALLIINGEDDA